MCIQNAAYEIPFSEVKKEKIITLKFRIVSNISIVGQRKQKRVDCFPFVGPVCLHFLIHKRLIIYCVKDVFLINEIEHNNHINFAHKPKEK